jgi:maltose O-acetyltransferase
MDPATQMQRMLAGELYFAGDAELAAARRRARVLCRRYNDSEPDQREGRASILAELLGACGSRVEIEPPFFCDYGFNIRLGSGVFLNFNCVLLDCHRITLGDNVLLGPGVHIYAATHPTDPRVRATGQELALPVTIGSNVWLGGGVIVCPGVEIGDDCVIGAGSVVTRSIPAGSVAVGNPCRVVR